jgi:autotransporter-associated beta strand protein
MKVTRSQKAKFSPLSTRINSAVFPALVMFGALASSPLHAQSTWNTTTGSWSVDFNWTPQAVPVSDFTTQLIFNATEAYTTTNDIGAGTFKLNRLTVNNTSTGTVRIDGLTAANTLTFGGTNPTLDITGNTLFAGLFANDTEGGTNTITKTGPGTFTHDSNNGGFTGTLVVDQGTFVNASNTLTATNFNPVSIVVNNGATYQFGTATTGNPNLPNSTYITVNTGGMVNWQEAEDFGGFHLQGGTINLQQGNANCNGAPLQTWTHGTLTATGGAFILSANAAQINKTTSGIVTVTGNASVGGSGSLNILDGTVSFAGSGNLGTVNVSLGDDAGTTTGTFDYQGVTATRGGFFVLKAGGGAINVNDPLTTLTLTGGVSGAGNLSKNGPGKLHLASTLDSPGVIAVNAGTLQVEPVFASNSFNVAGNSVLIVNSASGNLTLTTPGVNLMAGAATLQFDLNTTAVPTVPLMAIALPDALTFTGTPTLRLTNAQAFSNGTYPVLDYSGTPISSGVNLSLPGRTLGTLVYDTVNTKIDVIISGNDTVKWAGGINSDWDIGTAAGVGGTNNWKLATAGTQTNFINTDSITFDDTAARFDVNLTTAVQPLLTTVNAAANYTLAGPGKLSGTTALNKSGTGTLIVATDNDYSGGTNITQGTLQLGNGGTTGSVVGTITLAGGTLAFGRSDDYAFTNTVVIDLTGRIVQNGPGLVTFPNAFPVGTNTVEFGGPGNLNMAATVSGNGIINKTGTGTLTLLANNNAFTGTLNINGGIVQLRDLGAGGDLSASSIVVNNTGTFIFGPDGNADLADTATRVTINTGGLFRFELGENYGGFTLDGGEFRIVRNGRNVNSTAVATSEGATVYDLRSGTITSDESTGNSVLNQNGSATVPFGVLTKTTSGTVTVSGSITFQGALALQIYDGTLAMGVANFPSAGAAPVTLGDTLTGGTMQINNSGFASTSRPFTLQSGGGTINVFDAGAAVTLNGTVSGPGSLTKTGKGSLVLAVGNDYTGNTLVADGTLEANNFFTSATGSGPVTVAAAGTLAGEGSIITGAGNDVLINGKLEIGSAGAQQGTDFSITTGLGGSTVLGPASATEFDLWSSLGIDQSTNLSAADLLAVTGDFEITSGAVLKLTNPNALTFQNGDVFRLFDWTGLGTLTGTWTVDSAELNLNGLTLDTSNLYTSGTIGIVVPEPSSALLAVLGIVPCLLRRRRGVHLIN